MKENRFSQFDRDDWVTLIASALISLVGLYFGISLSVKMSMGYTLFGASNSTKTDQVEVKGPTGNDIMVLVLVWVLTALILGFVIYFAFFKKKEKKEVIHKDFVNGRTVILKEEKEDKEKHDDAR